MQFRHPHMFIIITCTSGVVLGQRLQDGAGDPRLQLRRVTPALHRGQLARLQRRHPRHAGRGAQPPLTIHSFALNIHYIALTIHYIALATHTIAHHSFALNINFLPVPSTLLPRCSSSGRPLLTRCAPTSTRCSSTCRRTGSCAEVIMLLHHFTGPPVPIMARMHSTTQKEGICAE
eukprot:4312201-Pyramimonas_sp.AAC.1